MNSVRAQIIGKTMLGITYRDVEIFEGEEPYDVLVGHAMRWLETTTGVYKDDGHTIISTRISSKE